MDDTTTVVGGVVGGVAGTGIVGVLVREFIRERRARIKIAAQQTTILAEMKVAVASLPTLVAALTAVHAAVDHLRQLVDDRTLWMLRERRPTPLRDDAAPDEVDRELTPVEGLRELRARTRTPPRGVRAAGRYGPRGGGRDPDDA